MRVGQAVLKLSVPEGLRQESGTLSAVCEQRFLPGVLEKLDQRIGARFGPDAILRVRDVRFIVRARPGELLSDELAEQLCDDLESYVVNRFRRPSVRHPAEIHAAPVQLFKSEAQVFSVRMLTASRRQPGPDGIKEDFAKLLREFVGRAPAQQCACLAEIADLDGLTDVLSGFPFDVLTTVSRDLRSRLPKPISEALRAELAKRRVAAHETTPTVSVTDEDPVLPALPADAEEQSSTTPSRPKTVRGMASDTDDTTATNDSLQSDRIAPAEIRPPDDPLREVGSAPEIADADAASLPRKSATAEPSGADSQRNIDKPDPPSVSIGESAIKPIGVPFTTRWCGLLYLVNISTRLGLPEALWQVGVSEGDVLATMLEQMSARDGTAASILSPTFPLPRPSAPMLEKWARDELSEFMTAALCGLDSTGGLSRRFKEIDAQHSNADVPWLINRGAALHHACAEHVLDQSLDPEQLTRLFDHTGQVCIDDDAIIVTMPDTAIDLDIRRAGLDSNPGWLPWLKKTLMFEFAGVEEQG